MGTERISSEIGSFSETIKCKQSSLSFCSKFAIHLENNQMLELGIDLKKKKAEGIYQQYQDMSVLWVIARVLNKSRKSPSRCFSQSCSGSWGIGFLLNLATL